MASPSITFYLLPNSSSLFPHILLRHCNIPFTPKVLHHPSKLQTDLDGVSSKQQVPVLVIDGNAITENPAIAHAINQLSPHHHLFGLSPTEFIKVCEWLNFISGPLHAQAWGPYIRPWRFTTDTSAEAQAAVKEAAKRSLLDRFATLEANLHPEGPWALGKHFTAVDVYTFPFFRLPTARRMEVDMAGEYPRWSRIVQALMGMDAVKKTLAFEEGSVSKV
ncbi:hypothetical protein LTR85_003319 [Meristemomyces frigidus]|nr:hypothetical protein LTR85_003319 [Meristemomyces frigidus]